MLIMLWFNYTLVILQKNDVIFEATEVINVLNVGVVTL